MLEQRTSKTRRSRKIKRRRRNDERQGIEYVALRGNEGGLNNGCPWPWPLLQQGRVKEGNGYGTSPRLTCICGEHKHGARNITENLR
ncbi:unnamed protein product [Urochloa humidicola]